MREILVPITIALFFMVAFNAFGIEIELSANQTSATLQERFQVQVAIKGTQRLTSFPQFVTTAGLRVQNGGTSSQVKLINGKLSVEKVFQFLFTPQKTGSFTIGPAKIEHGGQVYTSNPLNLTVTKTPKRAAIGDTAQNTGPYFIKTTVSNPNPYLHQQIVFTFKLYSRGRILDAKLDLPKFEGFWKEELSEQKQYRTVKDGHQWEITEIKLALFPTTAGEIQIEQTGLNVQVLAPRRRDNRYGNRDSFFGSFFGQNLGERKKLRLQADPIKISVKELPKTGKNPKFSGLVGKFKMASSLSKNHLKVGESTTLTLKIEGRGNIKGLTSPEFEFKNFKVYQDKPQNKTWHSNDIYYGSRVQSIALVPQQEGLQELPPVKFQYFDPELEQYQYLAVPSIPIQVAKALEEEKLNLVVAPGEKSVRKKQIKVLGADLMPIKREVYKKITHGISIFGYIFSLFSIFLLPLFYMLFRYLKKRHDRISSDAGILLKENAYRNFQKGLKKLSSDSDLMINSSSLLRNYIGNKLGIDGKALTPKEALLKLSNAGVMEPLAQEVSNFLKTCEMGIYGGVDSANFKGKQIPDLLSSLVKRLAKELR